MGLPATWFIDALMKHFSQEYYVGLLTAAALHGAAHQQPMTFQVITDKRTRNITVGELFIEFICKKLGIDQDEWNIIMNLPLKKHSDYKTDKNSLFYKFLMMMKNILK